jgi:Ca-activated chloride channel family protein
MKNSNAIWLVLAALVLAGMGVYAACKDGNCFGGTSIGTATGGPAPAQTIGVTATITSTASPAPPRLIKISMASSLTKKEWLEEAVKAFNAASQSDSNWQVNKTPVVVEILLEESPVEPGKREHYRSATQVNDTLAEKIKPTILSPADEVWVLKLNKEWRALYSKEVSTGKPAGLVRTPVVIAMWQSRAEALGCWPAAQPECTWERIRVLAASPNGWGLFGHPEWGKFKFGYSYVGEADVATWTAVLLCMSGQAKYTGLTIADVETTNGCGQAMAAVEKAKVHSGVSSPALLAEMQKGGPEYLDAVTTYEKEVIKFNQDNRGKLREPLVAAYPRDATAVARHPFAILDQAPWVSPEQVEGAKVFQRFLLSAEQQNALPTVGRGMRPAAENASLGSPIDASNGANPGAELVVVSLSDLLVLDRIIEVWHQVKKHAYIVLVFDKSGSMQGEKITEAVKGAGAFVGAMDADDWLAWVPFDDRIYPGAKGLKRDIGEQLQKEIRSTTASGGTALYDAICQAYKDLEEHRKSLGDTVRYGIVVLSDGRDTNSRQCSLTQLEANLRPPEKPEAAIHVHTIGIGDDADIPLLKKIASFGPGKFWEIKKASVAEAVYREIAKYF